MQYEAALNCSTKPIIVSILIVLVHIFEQFSKVKWVNTKCCTEHSNFYHLIVVRTLKTAKPPGWKFHFETISTIFQLKLLFSQNNIFSWKICRWEFLCMCEKESSQPKDIFPKNVGSILLCQIKLKWMKKKMFVPSFSMYKSLWKIAMVASWDLKKKTVKVP